MPRSGGDRSWTGHNYCRKLTRKTPADSAHHEKPRSISMDLLIETSAFKEPDCRTLSANHIQDTEPKEKKETPYLVIESSRESVGDPHQEHSSLIQTEDSKLCSSKKTADHWSDPSHHCNGDGCMQIKEENQRESSQLQSPKKKVLTPKAATYSSSSSSSSSSRTDPEIDQTDQRSQVSFQDSALSRLIDAVSLGNENDTCGSISALIGQFDVTVEQSPLYLQPLRYSLPPNDLPHFNNELSSTPLKVIQESTGTALPLPDRSSSPATTEPEVFTILDEEVLSPVSAHNLYQKNFQKNLVSSPIRLPLERSAGGNINLVSNKQQRYGSQCHSTGSLMNYEFGGYRETSMNSTVSDRFLICQDSASSSLMEVEINVDGDPLDNTLTSSNQDHHWCNDFRNGSNHLSPYHVPRLEPSHLHKPSYHPSPVRSYSTDTSAIHRHYQSSHQSLTSSTGDQNKSQPRRFPLGTHRIDTTEERHQDTRYQSGRKVEHLPKSSLSSECLARTQGRHTSFKRDLYTPVTDIDMIYNSVALQDYKAPLNSYSPQKRPPPVHSGSSPASSSKVSNTCKSKSLGDLTSEDISCNFQSKYKFISRSFVTPAMRDQRRMCGLAGRPKSSDPLTEQLRKLVTLEHEDYPHAPSSSSSQPTTKVLQSTTDDPEDPPPFLSRRLSSRSQSRVRHIANRAREKQQEAFKHRPVEGSTDVVLRNKLSSQNPPPNRHSTGSYIAGYLDQLGPEDRGLPEGACTTLRYGYGDGYYADDSVLPPDFSSPAEPEVYFLLRL